ncbi:hypothetical protein DF141_24010 [Burkholderia cenocepacia]|nr:hypothetical protein DF141_24010 [Burkholderia cenocepacia]RQV14385.1 hypothetical protein DF039_21570 [Burkholderia cenocepacia]RQZ90819.1 hypothetical protein DF058_24700 [Burkholderia cenocepacia]RRA11646.1 hypothetical protein DF059_23965 [Burkholderia cenocepacia]
MISAANFHSCFGRWNSTGRYLNFNEIVVRQLRVGHSDYRFMRINEMAEMDGGCWWCRGDGEADAVLDGCVFTGYVAGSCSS